MHIPFLEVAAVPTLVAHVQTLAPSPPSASAARADRSLDYNPVSVDNSSALTASLLQKVDAYFAGGSTNRQTCACCNELFAPPKMKSVEASGNWLRRLRNRLTWQHTTRPVNSETKQFYDVSATEPELINVPLAKAGVVANGHGSSKVKKCLSCPRD